MESPIDETRLRSGIIVREDLGHHAGVLTFSGCMEPQEIHDRIMRTADPVEAAGLIGITQTAHEDVELILQRFGDNHLVWLGLLDRADLTQEWIERASRVAHPSVLGRLPAHRFVKRGTVEWVAHYAAELAAHSEGEEADAFRHVAGYAGRSVEQVQH